MERPEILETRLANQAHINIVRKLLRVFAVELLLRGESHDLSKMMPEEIEAFTEYSPKLKGLTYGSPEYKDCLVKLGPSLQHHYANNRHHPEHFGDLGIQGMTLVDLVEMFIDWLASTKRHADGDILKSIEVNKDRFKMSPDLVAIFKNTVEVLNDK